MKKQQFIQLLQFIVAWILVRLFVVFVVEESFVDFVLKYRVYLLFVSVSYFYYYSIEYEQDKKYRFIRTALICWNVYLFAHIFFRPLLNISHELFVILWLIILWLWGTTKIKGRWRYLLQIIGWILSFFILISWIFYLYPDKPDVEWFIDWKKYEISVMWVLDSVDRGDAYIQIINNRRSNDFEITPSFSKILTESCKVSYPSLKTSREEKVVIMTPQWDVVWMFPQSEVQLEFSWKDLVKISKLTWKVWFLSWVFTWVTKFIWSADDVLKDEEDFMESVQYMYKYEFVEHLQNQISDSNISWANNTIMYDIDWKIIRFLVKLFPTSFINNLRNYNEFQNYFSWILKDEVDLGRYSLEQRSGWSIDSFLGSLKNGMNAWKVNMYNIFKKH